MILIQNVCVERRERDARPKSVRHILQSLTNYFGVISQTTLLAFTVILYYQFIGLYVRQCTEFFSLASCTLEVGLFFGIG
jgi:hypothetical protein